MKILRIAGRNLASLAGDFSVDFDTEPLASCGLFAISGPTGAGKSTLLDALCLALYGSTPRLPRTGGRGGSALPDAGGDSVSTFDARNLLRRGAAEGYAEVDFVGSDAQRYRARWSVRRARNKANGALQPSSMSLLRLPDEVPLGATKTEVANEIALRIGLSFEQFTRSVLLAQNEFSAFLKTDENERGELLETLTGSTVYSAISRRAFERYKHEQEAGKRLSARLADQTPLSSEDRTQLDADCASADTALASLEQQRALCEAQLRWHQEAARILASISEAEAQLATARCERDAAAPRRQHLATLTAVQSARPLTTELARLDSERTRTEAQLAAGQIQLTQVSAHAQQCASQVHSATLALDGADAALRAAAPELDAAKALDASIQTLSEAATQLAAQQADSAQAASRASASLQAVDAEAAATQAAATRSADWLAAHQQHTELATQWPRWEPLLAQAQRLAAQEEQLRAQLAQRHAAHSQLTAHAQAAQASLQAAQASLTPLEAARQQAASALAGFDLDALHAGRRALDEGREQLTEAHQDWRNWQAGEQQLARLDSELQQIGTAQASARTELDATSLLEGPLAASAAQAERALAAVELASAASVEALRAQLSEGEACPVCGSATHPYTAPDAGLDDARTLLLAQVQQARAALQSNRSAQATHQAQINTSAARLTELSAARATHNAVLAEASAAWQAHQRALAAPESGVEAWFSAQQTALREALLGNDTQLQAARSASQARDQTQAALDHAQAELARLSAAAASAQTALADSEHAQHSTRTQLEREGAALAEVLATLAPVLQAAVGADWQAEWRAAPGVWQAARAAEADAWTRTAQQLQQQREALTALAASQRSAAVSLSHTQAAAQAALEACARHASVLENQRSARAALFDGRSVQLVEDALLQAQRSARASLSTHQLAANQAREAEISLRSAVVAAQSRIGALQQETSAANQAINNWLANWNADAAVPLDQVALASLLSVDAESLAAESRALDALDQAFARIQTVLAERRAQHALHQQSAPPDAANLAADSLAQQLDTLVEQRRVAHDAASALRLRAAQDDERRHKASAMLAEIEAQQALEQRWGRLSELIGSADGKKFRNYAQQFTLDVLLGYANRHLLQLARRYRLERVDNDGAPSLALMVRDQDMGGEIRSVNSLSGGESFLVSLALALGLASLSSNRVKVESLFIDEGFGSLDSDTLTVAMDALDALQAMGRKVGVISHVHEMTERIAVKIQVRPGGGGSSVLEVI